MFQFERFLYIFIFSLIEEKEVREKESDNNLKILQFLFERKIRNDRKERMVERCSERG